MGIEGHKFKVGLFFFWGGRGGDSRGNIKLTKEFDVESNGEPLKRPKRMLEIGCCSSTLFPGGET